MTCELVTIYISKRQRKLISALDKQLDGHERGESSALGAALNDKDTQNSSNL